jgi:hypothetical protein
LTLVIAAQAGIQQLRRNLPITANSETSRGALCLVPSLVVWIPACPGMTGSVL